ncbi:tRNA (guanine-N(7)-)-methyltransferase (tRNA(m7G46)-methyltransferase) [Coemansia sp. BCRC 34301]|nr:tRNA (guanine-N(7)-)-methyltransferase (tRNA(m7G46)-methyltransferase) [Coemansia sp. BCRC 34301]
MLVAALRVGLGYLLLAPFILGAVVTTLLGTNVAVSYWFQRRRERKQKKKGAGALVELPLEPPVQRIPRLAFCAHIAGKEAGGSAYSSLFPTVFNHDRWEQARVALGEEYGQLSAEVGIILGLVVRDFVQDWFRELSADPSFPRCVQAQIGQAVESVAERARGKIDAAEFMVGHVLPLVTTHIRAIRDCEALVQDGGSGEDVAPPGSPVNEAGATSPVDGAERRRRVELAYAAMPAAKWHPALHALSNETAGPVDDDSDEERDKLREKRLVMAHVRRVIDLILPLILGPDQSSFTVHRVLVRELLSGALLAPLVISMAEPDTINQLVDGQLERLIREQHMVTELRDALDRQARGMGEDDDEQQPLVAAGGEGEDGSVLTYEQFMTTIDQCADATELARIHDDILAQIRKRRILIMGQSKDDIVHGQRVRDVIVYVNRLYVAKKKAERRLEMLRQDEAGSRGRGYSASSSSSSSLPVAVFPSAPNLSRASTYYEHRDDPARLGPPQFTLREMLTNVSSLSAFAEYMDLIGHRFVLEFWVNVEGVRQPHMLAEVLPSVLGSLWKSHFTLRVDELAALGSEVEAGVSRVQRRLKPYRQPASLELDVERMAAGVCEEAFDLICLVQAAVFRHMEAAEFPAFLRSALYSRFLREYYVTSRQDHLEASLFATAPPHSTRPARPPRRLSLARTVAESIGRRSVSGESSASAPPVVTKTPIGRAWTFGGMRGRAEAPLVSTDTSEARGTHAQAAAEAVVREIEARPRRRSARVGRSEVRRLSASLRSIGLGEAVDSGSSSSSSSPILEPITDDDDPDGPGGPGSAQSDSADSAASADSASALVIGRAVATPAPGDLFVGERLALVSRAVGRTTHQMAIVRALMRKAASRHRAHEQRVLRASFRDLRRDALAGASQQRAYTRHMADHVLSPERTRVHIPRAIEAADAHVVYLIELQQRLPSAPVSAAGWVVARRYREFFALHRALKAEAADAMRGLPDLPARTAPGLLLVRSLQRDRDLVDTRRRALEAYLQGLLGDSRVCGSRALRLFLSSVEPPAAEAAEAAEGGGWMQRIYKTVGDDIGGVTGADSMLELIVQELGAQVAMQQPQPQPPPAAAEAQGFVDPLSDLFVEVFGLKSRRNWLRRQAISILLRHIVGGAVERRIRDAAAALLADSQLAGLAAGLRTSLWPPGPGAAGGWQRFCGFARRSAEQADDSRRRARSHVLWYVPRMLAGMVGRKNARDGAALLVDAVQLRRPNLSLVLSVFDAVVGAMFPEIKYQLEQAQQL